VFQGKPAPTHALILFSDSPVRRQYFPYAKIECARFKGADTGTFIDQKTIDTHIGEQAEQAYEFVLRHINKSAVVEGVYTNTRWQYPVVAIRDAIRNAVVHRDYALTGRDVKVAIFDDMIEITSPGKLLPSIDFDELEARQSDIRNKVIAPVFKRVGLIDQWGNGLKLIADELKDYPEIEFKWFERGGLQFQVQFINKEYVAPQELQQELQQEQTEPTLYSKVLNIIAEKSLSRKGISMTLKQRSISGQLNAIINALQRDGLIEWTIPEVPKSSKQQFRITARGVAFLKLLD